MINKEAVLKVLSGVNDPDLDQDLVSLGMIEDLEVSESSVSFSIVLTTPACPMKKRIEQEARSAVQSLGVKDIKINMTARVRAPQKVNLNGNSFKQVIAVGSGKGGVGKSTVALNVALTLAMDGAQVGLLDADIYGPNIPRMIGVFALPEINEDKKPRPVEYEGVKVVSIGFIVEDGQPLIWRGPLLNSAIQQFLTEFDWGDLDYLIIDFPPGTGDVQLSVAQSLPITGAVLVSTPQQVAMDDASRAASMFDKLNVPVLGIVENMAYLPMADGSRMALFGEGGGERFAYQHKMPLLGQIPIDEKVGQCGDHGNPVVFFENTPVAQALRETARNIAAEASKHSFKG